MKITIIKSNYEINNHQMFRNEIATQTSGKKYNFLIGACFLSLITINICKEMAMIINQKRKLIIYVPGKHDNI